MHEISVNNGRKIRLSSERGAVIVEHIDHKGETERRDRISDGDIITALNWITYQKENGNPGLMF